MGTYDLTGNIPSSIQTGDILNCPYSGTYKTLTLPKGQYKLECWGAQGGKYSNNIGGKGGYSYGNLNLTGQSTILYLYTGGVPGGSASTASMAAGYNGGSATNNYGGGGGGASDIRIGQDSLYARVIVAGGGGGPGYNTANPGGYGGGTSGGAGTAGTYSAGGGGTQTAGGSCYNSTGAGTFGNGGSISTAGGGAGGGWYGGGHGYAGSTDSAGGGGSGYIYTSSTASNYPSGCLLNSSYYLTDASTIAGNTSFTDSTGSTVTGHEGNGYIRITVISINQGLECYYKSNSAWSAVTLYNKQSGSWTDDLEEIPSVYLKIAIPTTSSSLSYNGSSQSPTWTNYISKYVTMGGTTSASTAGDYTTTFTLKEGTYKWIDDSTASKSISWSIAVALVMPVKGDLITMDLGNGNKQYRILKITDTTAECLSMYHTGEALAFNTKHTITIGSQTCIKYENGTLDNYLNDTFYNSLSNTAKSAIVANNIVQDAWYHNSSNPTYNGDYQFLKMTKIGNTSAFSKYIYALSIQDILDYLGVTTSNASTTLTTSNIGSMFWSGKTDSIWLRSGAVYSSSNSVAYLLREGNYFYQRDIAGTTASMYACPVFKIDLSQITWTPYSA